MPGVVAVLTHDDLGLEGGVPCASNPTGDAGSRTRPMLADGRRAHVGEPVAIVLAETAAHGARRRRRVVVDYDPLPDGRATPRTRCSRARRRCTTSTPDNLCCTLEHVTDGFDAGDGSAAEGACAAARRTSA